MNGPSIYLSQVRFQAIFLMKDVQRIRRLWCSIGGEVKLCNFVSNKLIKVKFSTVKDQDAVISSVTDSLSQQQFKLNFAPQ